MQNRSFAAGLSDKEEANDLLQETSLKALDNEDKYMPDTNPITPLPQKNMPRALPWAINIKFVSLQSALFVFKQSLSVLVVAVGG